MKQIKNAFVSVFINNKYINISPRESRSLPVFKTIKILILRLVLSLLLFEDISNTVHTSTIPNNSVVASRNITGRRLENIDCPVRANTTAIAEVSIETVIICLLFIRLSKNFFCLELSLNYCSTQMEIILFLPSTKPLSTGIVDLLPATEPYSIVPFVSIDMIGAWLCIMVKLPITPGSVTASASPLNRTFSGDIISIFILNKL